MKTPAELFEEYRAQVMHPQAPPIQVRETRLAFFAGMLTAVNALTEMSDADEDVAAEGMALFDKQIQDEMTLMIPHGKGRPC